MKMKKQKNNFYDQQIDRLTYDYYCVCGQKNYYSEPKRFCKLGLTSSDFAIQNMIFSHWVAHFFFLHVFPNWTRFCSLCTIGNLVIIAARLMWRIANVIRPTDIYHTVLCLPSSLRERQYRQLSIESIEKLQCNLKNIAFNPWYFGCCCCCCRFWHVEFNAIEKL